MGEKTTHTARLRSKRPGFTLVELLVVIGIIGMLTAILMPALAQAREMARRAACLSNLRQIGIMLQGYANDFHDQVPLGSTYGPKLTFELAYYNAAAPAQPRYVLLGCLYADHLVPDGRIFYEPTTSDADGSTYDSANNPWSPGSRTCPNNNTVMLYGVRPVPTAIWRNIPQPQINGMLPKLCRMTNMAVAADWIWGNQALNQRHKSGFNVLYSNGSACWMNRGIIQRDLDALDTEGWSFDSFVAREWAHIDATP